MNLERAIAAIERAAMRQPSVNMIVRNDIFRLNQSPRQKYGVFAWLQNQHMVAADKYTFNFTLFYVDRLNADKSNETMIQSVGVDTLNNTIRTLEEMGLYPSEEVSMQVFNQRFADECAGVFANVSFETYASDKCAEQFVDFNYDYNIDYANGENAETYAAVKSPNKDFGGDSSTGFANAKTIIIY